MAAPRGTEHPWHALPGRGARPQAAELQRFCSPAATAQPRAEPGMPSPVQGLRATLPCHRGKLHPPPRHP